MADTLYIRYYWDPVEALRQAMHDATQVYEPVPLDGPLITEYEGLTAIANIYDVPSGTSTALYVMMTIPAGERIPAQYISRSPIPLLYESQFSHTGSVPSAPWSDIMLVVEEIWGGFIPIFFEAVCGAVAECNVMQEWTSAGGAVGTGGFAVTILTDSELLIMQVNCVGIDVTIPEGSTFGGWFFQSSRAPLTAGGAGAGPSLKKIEQALQEIADQDYEVGLNNGSAIFRVKGKSSITGPGGEG